MDSRFNDGDAAIFEGESIMVRLKLQLECDKSPSDGRMLEGSWVEAESRQWRLGFKQRESPVGAYANGLRMTATGESMTRNSGLWRSSCNDSGGCDC